MLEHQRLQQQLPRIEQMMPMRPAARPDRLVGLVPRLDGHVRHQALLLPAGEVLGHDRLDLALAREVGLGGGGEEGLLAGSIERFLLDPLDAVEPLLKDVVGTRLEVALLPAAQSVARRAIGQPVVAPQSLDRRAVGLAVEFIDHVAVLHRAALGGGYRLRRSAGNDLDVKTLQAGFSTSLAMTPCLGEITQLGASGTHQPVSGQRSSRQ